MSKSPVQKAFALIIREGADGCQLLAFEFESFDYEFLRLPGGNIEKNETPLEAARRETFEEAGIAKDVQRVDPELRTFLTQEHIPELFSQTGSMGRLRLTHPCPASGIRPSRNRFAVRAPRKRYPITKGSESREMKGSKPTKADDADPVNTIRQDSPP